MSSLTTVDDVRRRLGELHRRLHELGRDDVVVIAVTKAFPPALIRTAVDAGCASIGENYAQELRDKRPLLDELGDRRPAVHFIGQLQSNKVRLIGDVVDLWETVDRPSLVDELARRVPAARVLVQVNATGESGKGGCQPGDVAGLAARANGAGLSVEGLMTVGPTSGDVYETRRAFRTVRRLVDELELPRCSMGMTGDYEIALDEGTTQIRVGSLLFGARP